MKTILFSTLLLLSISGNNKLVGHWESISPTGNITGVVFKDDNTFEGFINNKPFVSGIYSLKDSTFQMQDNGCMGATGTYIVHFFANNDSFRIELIEDACEPRGNGSNNRVFGKVKK